MSILLYGCTTWTLTKRTEKKLDENCTRMLRAILNKSWKQHLTKQQLYGHRPPISKTIQIRRTRHAGRRWRSKDELISEVLVRTPSHGHATVGRPTRTYQQQLCMDTGCCLEDLLEVMGDRDVERERKRERERKGRREEEGESLQAAKHDDDDVEEEKGRRRRGRGGRGGEEEEELSLFC